MLTTTRTCLLAVTLLAALSTAQAQKALPQLPEGSHVAVTLQDGSMIYGTLERSGTDSVVVIGAAGRVAVAVAAVKGMRDAGTPRTRADGTVEYWAPNPNPTRLFFGPTGRTLAAGEGYFADHWIVLASVGVGVTDRIQLGGGTFIIPNSEFWALMPKVGIVRSKDFNVAAGALYGGVGDVKGGIGYLVGTSGSADNSVTFGVGQGISGDKVAGRPVYMLGGERRLSRRTALLTENYFGSAMDGGLVSYGMRFLAEKFTVDLGFFNSGREMIFPGIPYVDFVIRW